MNQSVDMEVVSFFETVKQPRVHVMVDRMGMSPVYKAHLEFSAAASQLEHSSWRQLACLIWPDPDSIHVCAVRCKTDSVIPLPLPESSIT